MHEFLRMSRQCCYSHTFAFVQVLHANRFYQRRLPDVGQAGNHHMQVDVADSIVSPTCSDNIGAGWNYLWHKSDRKIVLPTIKSVH